mmetsp:Transcript_37040/g.71050  ORF Transcript_37040/g.71050 Transcript_37040/m.71050 type:complete len:127 (+) Transcript_37040:850-1230(+)
MCNIGALGAEHDHSVFRDWYVREACARRPPSSSPDAQQQQQPQPHQPPQPPRRQLQRRRALAAAEEVRVVPPPDGNGPPVPTSPNFIGRPARQEVVVGEVQGRRLHMWDFTHVRTCPLLVQMTPAA